VFLRFLYPEPAPIRIVPILCGSLHEAVAKRISPMELEPVRRFVEALKEAVSARGKKVCCIASADLSHMGLQFGDREGISEYDLRSLSEEDHAMLTCVEKTDSEGFFESIVRDQDRRRVCGVPAIYTMLQLLEAEEGRLLKYGQAYTQESQSVVSFASLAFY
jgi:AmmeMemoRadiSam system protein B